MHHPNNECEIFTLDDEFIVIGKDEKHDLPLQFQLKGKNEYCLLQNLRSIAELEQKRLGNNFHEDWWIRFSKRLDQLNSETPVQGSQQHINNDIPLEDEVIKQFVQRMVMEMIYLKSYDARIRSLMKLLLKQHNLNNFTLVEIENLVCSDVLNGSIDVELSSPTLVNLNAATQTAKATEMQKSKSWASWACIGGAATAGALALGYTGGAAAPLVGSSLGSVATAGGMSAELASLVASTTGGSWMTYLFGVAGASIVSQRTKNRIEGLKDFHFKRIEENNEIPENSEDGWIIPDSGTLRVNAGKRNHLSLTIFASGWVHSEHGFTEPWKWLCMEENLYMDCLAIEWAKNELQDLGTLITRIITGSIASHITTSLLSKTVLNGVITSLTWPAAILKCSEVIDNTWSLVKSKADKAGYLLAELLASRVYGFTPITLVGFSFGGRMIFKCLCRLVELAKDDPSLLDMVEDCYIFGAPIRVGQLGWQLARKAVSGRFVNGYSENDWILRFGYRNEPLALVKDEHELIAGLSGIQLEGIENVCLSPYIKSQADYPTSMEVILQRVGFR